MNIQERIKERITQAKKTGMKLHLSQIAEITGVRYDRLHRLMTRPHYKLSAVDAEKIQKAQF